MNPRRWRAPSRIEPNSADDPLVQPDFVSQLLQRFRQGLRDLNLAACLAQRPTAFAGRTERDAAGFRLAHPGEFVRYAGTEFSLGAEMTDVDGDKQQRAQ